MPNAPVMQSLWAKVGQAHRCRCSACSKAVGSIGRRATGVAGRRKATFAEIFTACYSSVFATAAMVDAVHKDARRMELDRQLEETRRELSELQERSSIPSPFEATSPHLTIYQMDSLWRSLKGIYRGRPYMKEIHKPATVTASKLISSLKTEYYNAVDEPCLRAMRKTNYEQIERDIAAEELDGLLNLRPPRNQTQLLKDSLSTIELVQRLLRRAEIFDNGANESTAFDEARNLSNSGRPNFSFPTIDPERAAKNSALLNSQIRALISAEDLSFKERIGRVCYNLMVSAYPPDMHTYNTFIVALDKSGYHVFSEALVYSFFHQRLMKPTPSTYAAVLNHYKSSNNHGQFLRVISCLAGLDKWTGAKIRRRHIDDIAQTPFLQEWAADTTRRTQTGPWVWEHGPLSTTLVETALSGLLHFKLFADAAALFITCLRSGVVLSSQSIMHLFEECIAALDWKAAVRMVRGLMCSLQEWEILLSKLDEASTTYLLSRTSVLIDLCGLGSSGQEPCLKRLGNLYVSAPKRRRFLEYMAKANSLHPGTKSGGFQTTVPGACEELLASKRRVLQIESLWKEYEHVRKTTASIESKLLYPYFSISFRVSMALHIGVSATCRASELSHEIEITLDSIDSHAERDVKDDSLLQQMDHADNEHSNNQPEPEPQEGSSSLTATSSWTANQGLVLPDESPQDPGITHMLGKVESSWAY